jgi:ankyrin repeat protein
LEVKDKNGRTVLMKAASWGKLGVVKYLAENGADLEAKDKDGRTVLDTAKYYRKDDCVEFLEEYQEKVSAQKNKGDKTSGSQIVKANEGR